MTSARSLQAARNGGAFAMTVFGSLPNVTAEGREQIAMMAVRLSEP